MLPSLLAESAEKVDLIYIDPPFATGGDFSYTATVPDNPNTDGDQSTTFIKQLSAIEQKAYRDTWGPMFRPMSRAVKCKITLRKRRLPQELHQTPGATRRS